MVSRFDSGIALSPGTTAEGKFRINPVIQAQADAIQEKYKRPADLERFFEKTRLYDRGSRLGGVESIDPSGIARLNTVNLGLRDPRTADPSTGYGGATVLSLTKPQLTAVAPRNFGEFVGDFGRAAGDTLGKIGEKVLGGGVTMDLLKAINDKLTKKDEPKGIAPEDVDGILKSNNIQASINPLFNQQVFDPIRVSEMDPSMLMADNTVLDGILQNINKIRNFGTDMGLDRFRFDPLNPDKGIDFKDNVMINETPVDYNIGIDPSGNLRFGLGFDY